MYQYIYIYQGGDFMGLDIITIFDIANEEIEEKDEIDVDAY